MKKKGNQKYRRKKRQKSFGEYYIVVFLQYNNIIYTREKKFDGCRSLKNYPLRFDFFLEELNIAIEFQGKHHYEPINKYPRAKRVCEKTKIHDQIKRDFCKQNEIDLIEISYKDLNSIFDVLIFELETIVEGRS